ncbi:hypothetical protein Q5424_24770 [Conexibacter sp. JD483]|uniref:hypothetical protein n=1 Tax=unclassified Conexibacter TaxID=2627773 RepID=UPI00271848F5|nr:MULTISPECIES: hypothetical protein [unclassified Conexibacter]MDO8189329.1 hypothetical protein [Conexibacter sp. CPCC 205706]MDO8201606.1 hypothetical protein [Conexibacter sp. CPCC 205762]MDR9372336.1 hypothetical protein [Conexibacter sp. JD483]
MLQFAPMDPVERVKQIVLNEVVGFEVDGITILDAEFRAPAFDYFEEDEMIVVTLILTDPLDDGPGWPRETADAITMYASDTVSVAQTGCVPIFHFGAEHPNYGYGRVSRG